MASPHPAPPSYSALLAVHHTHMHAHMDRQSVVTGAHKRTGGPRHGIPSSIPMLQKQKVVFSSLHDGGLAKYSKVHCNHQESLDFIGILCKAG